MNRDRRHFLAAAAATAMFPGLMQAAEASPFRGIYPIAWTPCTQDGALDASGLAAQVAFCRRGQVAGLVWPQNASAWATLSTLTRSRPGGPPVGEAGTTARSNPSRAASSSRRGRLVT